MTSNDVDIGGTGRNGSSHNLGSVVDLDTKEFSWLIDNLPITIFRIKNDSSWSMSYISKYVEELTGHSKMDFVDLKIIVA